jgi:hypothetical protein
MNQSKTDLGIVNESQLLRFGISNTKSQRDQPIQTQHRPIPDIRNDGRLKPRRQASQAAEKNMPK